MLACRRQWKAKRHFQLQLHCRHGSQYSNSWKNGPSSELQRVIPFTQHVKAAEQTFEQYHGHGFFSARVSSAGVPEEIFLPFWVASATVHTQVVQAQVGRSVMRTRYNVHTRKNETAWETDWAWVQDPFQFTREYLPLAHPGMQIYASQKYRRGFVNAIRNGNALSAATPFSPQYLDRPSYHNLGPAYQDIHRKIDPFTIYPTTALRLAKDYIQNQENANVDAFLKKTYGADQTRLVQLQISIENVRISPVYYPAFVFTIHYLGRNLRTFINGYDLSAGGLRIYNWERVAGASALTMAALMAATGGIGWGGMSGSLWAGVVLPTLVTSLLTMYYPLISLRVRDAIRRREIQSQAQDERLWETNWTGAYNAYEDEKRYRTWRTEHDTSSTRTASSPDPKGYYRVLGLGPGASKADIQGAFRGLAMKHHPDRYSEPSEKKKAKEEFQAISEAYSVLRDATKRKKYDETGQA